MASRFNHQNVDQEYGIQTLFKAGSSTSLNLDDFVRPVYHPHLELEVEAEPRPWKIVKAKGPALTVNKPDHRSIENAIWREKLRQDKFHKTPVSPRSPKTSVVEDALPERDVAVSGPVIPTQYTAKGLFPHEVPVIGTHVDKSVIPGFRYRVRFLQSGQYMFEGKALPLLSVGLGYGKRLTFQGESLNYNPNFFWSDTNPYGYAFSIDAVRPGESFTVCDQDMRPIGRAIIDFLLLPQSEIATEVHEGMVQKKVKIAFACSIEYNGCHGLMSLHSSDTDLELNGVAVLTKYKGTRDAVLTCIEGVYVPNYGRCILEADL